MGGLDHWLVEGVFRGGVDTVVKCAVWGRVFPLIKGFRLVKILESVSCVELGSGLYRVEVQGRFRRGVWVRVVLYYPPTPKQKRRGERGGGFLSGAVADFLYDMAARHEVVVGDGGVVYIDGVEVDVGACMKRGGVDYGCVLRQIRQGAFGRGEVEGGQ